MFHGVYEGRPQPVSPVSSQAAVDRSTSARGFSAACPQAGHTEYLHRYNGLLRIPAQAGDDFSTAHWMIGFNARTAPWRRQAELKLRLWHCRQAAVGPTLQFLRHRGRRRRMCKLAAVRANDAKADVTRQGPIRLRSQRKPPDAIGHQRTFAFMAAALDLCAAACVRSIRETQNIFGQM